MSHSVLSKVKSKLKEYADTSGIFEVIDRSKTQIIDKKVLNNTLQRDDSNPNFSFTYAAA